MSEKGILYKRPTLLKVMNFTCKNTQDAHRMGIKFLINSKRNPNHPEIVNEEFVVFQFDEFSDDEIISLSPIFFKNYAHYKEILFESGIAADAIKLLKENIFTKRAVFSVWEPKHRTPLIEVPCLIYISFQYIDDKLNMVVHYRANDAVTKFPINLSILRCFHKLICMNVGVPCGNYIHQADSFHIYKKDQKKAREILKNKVSNVSFDVIITNMDLIQSMQSNLPKPENNIPLYKRVLGKKKPNIQILDRETVNWMAIHSKPKYTTIQEIFPKFKPVSWDFILPFIPPKNAFRNKTVYSSIHGLTHATRVIIYAIILSEKRFNKQFSELLIAAGHHDIRRIRDSTDQEHTKNIINWLKKSTTFFDSEVIQKTIKILSLSENANSTTIVKLLRDADALDRYRLPSEKWWPNSKYLTKDGIKMLEFAKFFIWKSEKLAQEMGPLESVKKTAIECGVVINE